MQTFSIKDIKKLDCMEMEMEGGTVSTTKGIKQSIGPMIRNAHRSQVLRELNLIRLAKKLK